MNQSHLSILCHFIRSLTNQQIENYHVTTLLVLLGCFELIIPNSYDSVQSPLVCTRELINFEFFAEFMQIIGVCGQTLKAWATLDVVSSVSHRWRTFLSIFSLQLAAFSDVGDFQHAGISNETFQ